MVMVPYVLSSSPSLHLPLWKPKAVVKRLSSSPSPSIKRSVRVKAFFYNPTDDPVVKEALKEPIAFMGGMFAGFLRLDLNEDPLKEWVARTVEASGIPDEDTNAQEPNPDDEGETPLQIEIE